MTKNPYKLTCRDIHRLVKYTQKGYTIRMINENKTYNILVNNSIYNAHIENENVVLIYTLFDNYVAVNNINLNNMPADTTTLIFYDYDSEIFIGNNLPTTLKEIKFYSTNTKNEIKKFNKIPLSCEIYDNDILLTI